MIKANRLLTLLSPQRFELAWEHWIGRQFDFDFVRASSIEDVFEHIEINSQGKRGEAVSCGIWVSPLKRHRVHFIPSPDVDEFLVELCACMPERSYTLIENESDAKNWETQVADLAPTRVYDLAQKHGQIIADQTKAQRRAAKEYLQCIREITDEPVMEYLAYQLRSRATPNEQREADRMAQLACMPPLDDVNEAIACAALAIAMFGSTIDQEHHGFRGESPNGNRELRLRLDIIADRLRSGRPT
jgi:hypothetical protein